MTNANQPTITYDNWTEFLFKLGAVCSPAELQGMLCGTLVSGQRLSNPEWVDVASAFMDLPEKEVESERTGALVALYDLTMGALQDDNYGLKLIVPEDALPLATRVEGLAAWCQGFLHGMGSAGEAIGEKLDEDGQATLRDIAQIAHAHADADEDESEEVEQHYMELVEYVRLAVISLFAELNPAPKLDDNIPPAPSSMH